MFPMLFVLAAWGSPTDEAIDALVNGDERSALRVLRGALKQDPDGRIRCLLAEVALHAERPSESLAVLEGLPEDAACAGRASFVAAEAVRSLGREDEAATRYAELTERLMRPEVQPLTRRLEQWADRILEEEGQTAWAATLLLPAAQLEVDPGRRLTLARRIARLAPVGAPRGFAVQELSAAIRAEDSPGDRRLLAPLLSPEWSLALLAPLPDDVATQVVRIRVAPDLSARHALAEALIEAHPTSEQAQAVRLEVGLELAAAGWVVEAREFLGPLSDETSGWALARLAVRGGDATASETLRTLLKLYPTASFRAEAEAELERLHLDALRRSSTFDGAAWDAIATTPELALEACWAAPEPGDRLDELIARWPYSDQAQSALRHRALTMGLDWLNAHESPAAGAVRQDLLEPEIGIRSDRSGVAEVQLLVRGADQLELRLHRIDLEGWLDAGGRPGSLGELDVAIVAPDRIWTAEVPGEGLQREFTLPIDVPGPGLYSVTAGTADRQARTLLLVTSTKLLARSQGPDLAMSALHDGRPVPGAEFLVRSGDRVEHVTADRDGLARTQLATDGDAVVVAVTRYGPALLEIGAPFAAEAQPIQTAVDLDRPVYRPGDVVRFRALALRAGDPVRGPWTVSLEQGGRVHQEIRLQADRSGTIEGEVVIPWMSTGRYAGGAGEQGFELRALPPEHDSPISLAQVRVIDAVPLAHDIAFEEVEGAVQVTVVDGMGVPVVDLPLHIDEELQRTDGSGLVQLVMPPAGVPWSVEVRIPGERERHRFSRGAPDRFPHAIRLADPRAAPGEAVQIELSGEGAARLRVVRLESAPIRPEAPAAPAAFTVPALKVYQQHQAGTAPSSLRTTVSETPVDLAGGSVELPGLPAGWYRIELVQPDGLWSSIGAALEVRTGARIRLDTEPTVGRVARVRVDGGWALLTAEGGRMVAATLVPPGASRTLEVDRRWHGGVSLVASTETDQHIRRVEVDASLDVTISADIEAGQWRASGQVTDAAGNPMRAEVMVRAVDTQLIAEAGPPASLPLSLLESPVAWPSDSASAFGLSHGGWAVALAAELMAEAARDAESRRAALAAEGRLSESRLLGVLAMEVPLERGGGGLGSRGSGFGGGGVGSGAGGLSSYGKAGGQAGVSGRSGVALRGHRESGLWRVVQTDRQGRWSLTAPAPTERRHWQVDAVAVAPGSMGRAGVVVESVSRPWFAADTPGVGEPGDRARPRVRVVNPGPAATVVLKVDGKAHSLKISERGVAIHSLELSAGQSVVVALDGQSSTVAFPLRNPERIEGPDRLAAALGLAHDPAVAWDVGRAAVAGRAALAVWPVLNEVERIEAQVDIRAALGAVRRGGQARSPRDAAQGLLLFAEAAELLDVPEHEVSEIAAALTVEPGTPRERLELAWARSVAGEIPQEATLGRLVRDRDRLDEEGQALLYRLMHKLRRPTDWEPAGTGTQAVLARRLGRKKSVAEAPTSGMPPLGHPDRADWLRASLGSLSDETSVAALPEPPKGGKTAAARWPAGLAGRPETLQSSSSVWGDVRCGTEQAPCRIALGEALAVTGLDPRWRPGAGLRWSVDRHRLVARSEGTFVLSGLGAPLHVQIGEGSSPLGQAEILAVASLQQELGHSAAPLLTERPSLEDWDPAHRGQAARVRFRDADPDDAAGWVAAFEDLRDEVPSTPVELSDVVSTAGAYHAVGRPGRAIQVYERAIGQLFLREAAVASEIEGVVGSLAAIQALRHITARYPGVPLVQQAEFALPDRLLSMIGNIPEKARSRGVTDTELRLMAAAWDREFVALAPSSPMVPEAGLRLATGLLEMGAKRRTLTWTERLQRRHPEHALLDRWLLLEALVRTELGESRRALAVLERLSSEELPLEGGRLGPSALRDDARFALGRLAEAEGRFDEATIWYEQVQGVFPQASLAATALKRVFLETEHTVVANPLRDRSTLIVQAANLEEVSVRAYAVDLRTLFLRESGLPRPEEVRIDGLRPDYTSTVSMEAGPFPVERRVDLPLTGAGAWLVRLDGRGQSAMVWVLRSNLELDHVDASGMRRLVARLSGAPTAEVPIRAVGSGGIVAEATDIRGVALVGSGSPSLAQVGAHYALTSDAIPEPLRQHTSQPGALMPSNPSLLDRVQSREVERRAKSRSRYDFIGDEANSSIEAWAL